MKKSLSLVFLFSIFLIGGLLAMDSFGSNVKVQGILGVSSITIALFSLPYLLVLRSRGEPRLDAWKKPLLFLGSFFFACSTVLTIWSAMSPPNLVYSITRLHPLHLLVLSQLLLGSWILSQSNAWWKRQWQKLLWIFPFYLFGVSFILRLLPFDIFVPYASEDGFMEYMQVLLLIIGIGITVKEVWHSSKKSLPKRRAVFLFLSLALAVILLEEISWGQRLFGWQTPEKLSEVNVQNETTIHNIGILNELQLVVYILISFAGLVLSRIPYKKQLNTWYFWQPFSASSMLFLFPFLFYFGNVAFNTPYHLWAEIMEVVFYLAVVSWIAAGTQRFGVRKVSHK